MTAVAHVGLAVADLARSVRFYTELFGFRVDRTLSLNHDEIDELLRLDRPSDLRVVYLVLEGFTLELLQFDPASTSAAGFRVINQTGLTHLALVRDAELATFRATAAALGATIVSEQRTTVMLRDPDGQLVEVLPPDYPARVARGGRDAASALAACK